MQLAVCGVLRETVRMHDRQSRAIAKLPQKACLVTASKLRTARQMLQCTAHNWKTSQEASCKIG